MHTVQRHFGKYMKRTADEQQVSVLLKDFEDADQLLSRVCSIPPVHVNAARDSDKRQIIDASKTWRESWISILTYQHRLFSEFDTLYTPIVGAGDDYHGHQPVPTSDKIMRRTSRIKMEYDDLKKDLTEDLGLVDQQMIRPAQDAKDSLHTLKKTIKKREDKKLDFERYQNRVDSGLKKTKRSERENAALAKSQSDLAIATDAYNAADEHLRNCLPPILTSVFSLLPHILTAQIQIQNSLLGHYYTLLHTYCLEEGFPSPSPPMDEVIRRWDDSFKTVQQKAESIAIIANGKAVRTPMGMENGHGHSSNGLRRPRANSTFHRVPSVSPARALPPSPSYDMKTKISSSPSPSATFLLSPTTPSETMTATASTSPSSISIYQTPLSFAPAAPNTDYFVRDRQPSAASSIGSTSASAAATGLATIAQKKRPPPPPPRNSSQQSLFVTALYDFGGQGEGDLAFKEGDRIKVLKKTDSTDDWWQGELRGVKGAFPANYCQK